MIKVVVQPSKAPLRRHYRTLLYLPRRCSSNKLSCWLGRGALFRTEFAPPACPSPIGPALWPAGAANGAMLGGGGGGNLASRSGGSLEKSKFPGGGGGNPCPGMGGGGIGSLPSAISAAIRAGSMPAKPPGGSGGTGPMRNSPGNGLLGLALGLPFVGLAAPVRPGSKPGKAGMVWSTSPSASSAFSCSSASNISCLPRRRSYVPCASACFASTW